MPIEILNVNSHSLGVIGTNPTTGEKQAALLIPRNTPIPASAERVFRTQKDGQSSILVQIVEGESVVPAECSLVGRCIVHNLPKNLPARTPITVCFQYNENGRLTVLVKVTGIELKQQILVVANRCVYAAWPVVFFRIHDLGVQLLAHAMQALKFIVASRAGEVDRETDLHRP